MGDIPLLCEVPVLDYSSCLDMWVIVVLFFNVFCCFCDAPAPTMVMYSIVGHRALNGPSMFGQTQLNNSMGESRSRFLFN